MTIRPSGSPTCWVASRAARWLPSMYAPILREYRWLRGLRVKDAVERRPVDWPLLLRHTDYIALHPLADPVKKGLAGASHHDWRAAEPDERRNSFAALKLSHKPLGPLRYHRQPKALGDPIKNEDGIVGAQNGAPGRIVPSWRREGQFARDGDEVTE